VTEFGATINRRSFLIGLGLSGLVAPSGALAQPAGRVARVGYISNVPGDSPLVELWRKAFVDGLREHGWIENQNVVIERRYAELRKEASLAVIGLVASLARPGGNVTGLSFVGTELAGKQVELLKEAVPGLERVAVLANPGNASHAPRTKEIAEVARALRIRSEVVEASTSRGIQEAFAAMAKRRPGAAIVLADPLFVREAHNLVRLAAEQRLPVMYGLREVVVAGGLISYGASFGDLFRRAATYVDKILRGASPSDLPVEQASKFELVINLKTARALGLTIPHALLARADEVIQ